MGWNFLVDGFQQHLKLVIAGTLCEALAGWNPCHRPVLDRKAEHLRETGLTGSEESRHPDGNTFVWFIGRLPVRVKNMGVVRPNSVSHDVLVDLVTQDIVIGLIDLDDLLDPTMDVVGKEAFDQWRCHGSSSRQKIFGR